jgi:hypothetical protein
MQRRLFIRLFSSIIEMVSKNPNFEIEPISIIPLKPFPGAVKVEDVLNELNIEKNDFKEGIKQAIENDCFFNRTFLETSQVRAENG